MPDTVESNLLKVLKGLPLEGDEAEICDYSLQEQNEALESQGIQPNVDPKYKPLVGETITYIVACVILNEHGEILMMQEAKQSCAGKWYLPAGRMEKGETITEACEREVLEETGLQMQCTTLLMVETAGGTWVRFVITGKITGGNLKTPAQADKESLQAKWVANLNELTLRATDITHLIDKARFVITGKITGGNLKTPAQADKESLQAKWVANLNELTLRATDITHLIDKARAYAEARRTKDASWFHDQLPALRSYSQLLLRLVIVIKKKATNRVHILLSERTSWHLPTCEINPGKSFHSTLRKFMVDIFGAEVPSHKPHGLLSVEHGPREGKDGACLTLLVAFRSPLEEVPIIGKCVWHEVSKELGDKLLQRVISRNATFQFHNIR